MGGNEAGAGKHGRNLGMTFGITVVQCWFTLVVAKLTEIVV